MAYSNSYDDTRADRLQEARQEYQFNIELAQETGECPVCMNDITAVAHSGFGYTVYACPCLCVQWKVIDDEVTV